MHDHELADIVGLDGRFGHRQHVHLAFLAVRRYGMPDAVDKVCGWLRQVAVPGKYHHTVSRAWVELVAHHATAEPFEVVVERNPALLDKRLLSRHYRSATLASELARCGWVEPDVAPFPWG
jgi:hypothetical protein